MHVDLTWLTPAGRPVDGLVISVAKPDDLDTLTRIMCEGFEFSAVSRSPSAG